MYFCPKKPSLIFFFNTISQRNSETNPSSSPPLMLCGDVTVFRWKILIIQVACTSDTTLIWGEAVLEHVYTALFQMFQKY